MFLQRRAAAACNLSCVRSIYRAVKLQYTVPRHALLQKRIRRLLGERRIIKSSYAAAATSSTPRIARSIDSSGTEADFASRSTLSQPLSTSGVNADCVHLIHDQRTHGFNLCLLRALDRHFQHFEAMFLRRMYKRFGLRFAPVILCRRGDNAEHRTWAFSFSGCANPCSSRSNTIVQSSSNAAPFHRFMVFSPFLVLS